MLPATAVLGYLLAVLPLIATPGASLTLLVRKVGESGPRQAAPVVLGTATGLMVHATLAVAGLSELVMHSSEAFEVVRLVGAGYLIVLGVKSWRTPALPVEALDPAAERCSAPLWPTYRQAVLANVFNPKAASLFLTLAPQFLDPHRPLAGQILELGGALCALVSGWLLCWTALLGGAARILRSPGIKRVWNRTAALVLIGLGVRAAV
jgi:threonine/homoserine/homoserine lactone efflux protein